MVLNKMPFRFSFIGGFRNGTGVPLLQLRHVHELTEQSSINRLTELCSVIEEQMSAMQRGTPVPHCPRGARRKGPFQVMTFPIQNLYLHHGKSPQAAQYWKLVFKTDQKTIDDSN
jgi:hypothetical protein